MPTARPAELTLSQLEAILHVSLATPTAATVPRPQENAVNAQLVSNPAQLTAWPAPITPSPTDLPTAPTVTKSVQPAAPPQATASPATPDTNSTVKPALLVARAPSLPEEMAPARAVTSLVKTAMPPTDSVLFARAVSRSPIPPVLLASPVPSAMAQQPAQLVMQFVLLVQLSQETVLHVPWLINFQEPHVRSALPTPSTTTPIQAHHVLTAQPVPLAIT